MELADSNKTNMTTHATRHAVASALTTTTTTSSTASQQSSDTAFSNDVLRTREVVAIYVWNGEKVDPNTDETCKQLSTMVEFVSNELQISPTAMVGWRMEMYRRKRSRATTRPDAYFFSPKDGSRYDNQHDVLTMLRNDSVSSQVTPILSTTTTATPTNHDDVPLISIIRKSPPNPATTTTNIIVPPHPPAITDLLPPIPVPVTETPTTTITTTTPATTTHVIAIDSSAIAIDSMSATKRNKRSRKENPVENGVVTSPSRRRRVRHHESPISGQVAVDGAPVVAVDQQESSAANVTPIAPPRRRRKVQSTKTSLLPLSVELEPISNIGVDLSQLFSHLPVPSMHDFDDSYNKNQDAEHVSRQLNSKAWYLALTQRRSSDPFLVFRRVPAEADVPKILVCRIEKTPPSVTSVDKLEAWLIQDRFSHRSIGALGASAEVYVGQDVLERIVPADYASECLSVAKRLGGHPVLFHTGDGNADAIISLVGGGSSNMVKLKHLAWSLSQAPHLSAPNCASDSIVHHYNVVDFTTPPVSSLSTAKTIKPQKTTAKPLELVPLSGSDYKDIMSSPASALGQVNLGDVLSFQSFARDLEPEDRAALYAMLPSPDIRHAEGVETTLDRNNHFTTSLILFQNLLRTGAFDAQHIGKARNKRRRMEGWNEDKERQIEAFYGQRLEPKPAGPMETAQWRVLDEQVVELAGKRRNVGSSSSLPTTTGAGIRTDGRERQTTTTTTMSSSSHDDGNVMTTTTSGGATDAGFGNVGIPIVL